MPRFVAGMILPSTVTASGHGVRPSGGREILNVPRARAWAVGHATAETQVCPARDGTDSQLVTAGLCLAGATERRAALAAARDGDIAPALRMPGSYLALVWGHETLRVAGDRAGVVPVYWSRHDGVVWWSTAAAALAALTGMGPNLPVLLADLTLTGVDTQREQSHYQGVHRVPPGQVLVLRDGVGPQVVPVAPPGPLPLPRGADRLREALTTAVGRRVEKYEQISADLSGGMDSSTVTCLAADSHPLLAVTYTDEHLVDDDDLIYARKVAAEVEGITHRIVDARHTGAAQFDGLSEPAALPLTDVPSLALGVLSVKEAQLGPVAAYGTRAHLTGRGGDNVLTAAYSSYVDQLLAGQRVAALRGTTFHARAQRVAPWRMWRQLGRTAAVSYPRALETLARTVGGQGALGTERSARWEDLAWCGTVSAADWLTRTGRRSVAEVIGRRVQVADPDTMPGALHDRLALEFMAGSHAMFDSIARQKWGVPVHAPFLDTAVVDACLSVPGYQRMREGVYKPLGRAAFTGLVPDFLLHRQTKTAFTTSLYSGLAANAPALRRIVAASKLAQAGLIDAHRAVAALESAIAGAPAPLADIHSLIVAELWLDQLHRQTTHATWWQTGTDRSAA
ncbi:albusnodin/ikarugamycin family macrolactam cyclase [Streptomyces sp. NPDC058595]|uniref:albusnodin/ikarugamycin family macrolactam cyclase n=1 Tax=Streptomyces sp. NPDC058595 TaxID=3346550 RepID=UPI00365DDC5D